MLEHVNMIILVKYNNRFLPASRPADIPSPAARLTLDIRRTNISYLDVVKLLDGVTNLNLVSLLVYLERIRIACTSKVHPLFGNERPDYNTVIIHVSTRLKINPALFLRETKTLL